MNLACEKHTWQTSEKYPSSKAVDGLCGNLSESGGQCAVSLESNADVTWLVDLANSDLAGTFLGFSVYVSNTTVKEDGYLCYHDTTYTPSTIPSSLTIECTMPGRYVIYFNTREGNLSTKPGYSTKAQINLCEVEVYGCPLGFYGVHCSKTCRVNCHHCSIVSGECLGDCRLGFSGQFCDNYERINMALHRPTFQLHTLFDGQPSSRLVDGKKSDLNILSSQCTSTQDGQSFVMWRVDLENYRRIERIVIYSRTDNKKWDVNNGFTRRLLGFSVAVSNTTDYNHGVICYHERKYNKYTIPSTVDFFCSAVGRYVIFYNERRPGISYPEDYSQYAFVDLCEIEVYGCPIPQYGFEQPACTLPCAALCKYDMENLSNRKQTWLSSPFSPFMAGDKAVDGRYTSRHYSSGQCAISKPSTQITWWVNLEKIHRIELVVIYFRTDNVQWGCPSPVGKNPQCSRPCPWNCEQCYRDTGLCAKCWPGFRGHACELPCQAIGNVTTSSSVIYNGPIYQALLSSNGLYYPGTERGYAYINMTLSEKSTNIVGLSFTLHQASNVMVTLLDNKQSVIKKYFEHSSDNQKWNVKVMNSVTSQVHSISVAVVYKHQFTISSMRLPLRKCKNEDISSEAQKNDDVFKYL
nr:uncharacterized protein LOC105323786 isoform X3 [Crassostrea gigas]